MAWKESVGSSMLQLSGQILWLQAQTCFRTKVCSKQPSALPLMVGKKMADTHGAFRDSKRHSDVFQILVSV